MNNASPKIKIRCARGVNWVRDIDMTLLANDRSGETFILRGVEAIVWDWLTLNFPYGKMAGLLAATLESPISEAESRLNTILRQWVENGLLIITENAAHD